VPHDHSPQTKKLGPPVPVGTNGIDTAAEAQVVQRLAAKLKDGPGQAACCLQKFEHWHLCFQPLRFRLGIWSNHLDFFLCVFSCLVNVMFMTNWRGKS